MLLTFDILCHIRDFKQASHLLAAQSKKFALKKVFFGTVSFSSVKSYYVRQIPFDLLDEGILYLGHTKFFDLYKCCIRSYCIDSNRFPWYFM